MGAITDVVRRYVPASYKAMVTETNGYYSLDDLQALTDYVQFTIYSTVVGASNEASIYDIRQKEFLGMVSALQFIPAAVEFWGDQLATETTTGTSETISYFDRRDQLWKLFANLQGDAKQLAIELGINLYPARTTVPKVSYGDNGRHILKTTDPNLFPKQYRDSNELFWPWNFVDPGLV